MGVFDHLFGRKPSTTAERVPASASDHDAAAAEYEGMLRTAPLETIERIHVEAFEKMTPEQLQDVYDRLTDNAENPADRPLDASPTSLAASATRAEARSPGTMRRLLERNSNEDPSRLDTNALASFFAYDTIVTFALTTAAWHTWSSDASTDPDSATTDQADLTPGIGEGDGLFDLG